MLCILQNMHERLLEMGRSLPSTHSSTTTPTARDTYTKERETFIKERASEGGTTAQGKREERDTPDSTRHHGNIKSLCVCNYNREHATYVLRNFSRHALIRVCASMFNIEQYYSTCIKMKITIQPHTLKRAHTYMQFFHCNVG